MRPRRAFQPGTDLALEERFLLSRQAYPIRLLGQAHGVNLTAPKPVQLYPIAEINAQYDAFERDFFNVLLPAYVQALQSSTPTPTTVQAPLAVQHEPNSGTFVLAAGQGAQFGNYTGVVTATVAPGTAPLLYTIAGRTGDVLTGVVPYFVGTPDVVLPVNTVIQANVGATSTSTNAGSVFQAALFQRAQQMANTLVQYFNSLPIQLPAFQGIPRQPGPRNLLQKYVYNSILGNNQTSLLGSLLRIPLPTDTDGALTLYKVAAQNAIEASRTLTITGIQQIWAGAKIPPHYNYP